MAKYKVAEVFLGRGKVYPLFGNEVETDLANLFDQPELLVRWDFDEFGEQGRGLCLKSEVPFLEMKLEVTKQVLGGKIMIKGTMVDLSAMEVGKMGIELLGYVRTEIAKRVKARL